MKQNPDKLIDALGMLREDTLQTCMTPSKAPARSLTFRRVATVMAATLTFALLAAAVLALPLLRPEDPPPHIPVGSDTESQTPPLSSLGWYTSPMANVQILALSAEEADSADMTASQDISMVQGTQLLEQQVYILFTLEEGETLTATAQNGNMAHSTLSDLANGFDCFDTWEEEFLFYVSNGYTKDNTIGRRIEIDSPEAFLTWGGGNRYYPQDLKGGTPDEDIIDFVVRNTEGHITGAGSIYLGNRKIVENTASRYYDPVSVSRGKVLGSVRFHDPATVTEEQVNELLDSLHAQADDLRKTLFENPTRGEQLVLALGDLINTRYGDLDGFSMSWCTSQGQEYQDVTVYGREDDDPNITYLLMEDGTWGEIQTHTSFCHFCRVEAPRCNHRELTYERFRLTNGKVLDVRVRWEGTFVVEYLVEVTEETYPTLTEYDLIESLAAKNSPMVDAIYQAYQSIKAEMDVDILADEVIHTFYHFSPDGNHLWHRYATLKVVETEGIRAAHRYFICENGEYAKIEKIDYKCETCGYTTNNLNAVSRHQSKHLDFTRIYQLTDGGSYVIPSDLNNGLPHKTESNPE